MDKETAFLFRTAQQTIDRLDKRLAVVEAKLVQINDIQTDLQEELADTRLDLGGHIHAS